MARINTNVSSVIAQSNLRKSTSELDVRLERLATGLRINRGKDDPAGLIISQRIQTDINGIEQAIKNGDRASSVIATTEAGLNEVNDLLNSIKALIVESANTGANSKEERAANQLAIDSAIQSITRISNTSSFGGLKLLNGELDYITSGISGSDISNVNVFSASFIGQSNLDVNVDVVASAQKASLYLGGAAPGVDGTIASTTTLSISGNRGVAELTFTSGSTFNDIITAVNQQTSLTGVEAALINPPNEASGMVFRSEKFGSDQFVSVERRNGPADPSDDPIQFKRLPEGTPVPDGSVAGFILNGALTNAGQTFGQNVQALINGSLATGDGLNVSTNSPTLGVEMLLDEDFATDPSATPSTFKITGGGSLFQLGPNINAQQQANIGVPSVAAERLGGTLVNGSLAFLSSLSTGQGNSIDSSEGRNDFTAASDILDAAIDEVSVLRGRLGAFERNVLETNGRSLQAAFENLTASQSRIQDADFALETSQLTRAQILQSSGTTVLGLANQSAQSVLQLLG